METTLDARKLRAASLFASTEETRYYLQGVLVEPRKGGGVTMVATDGVTLFAAVDDEAEALGHAMMVIPTDVLKRVFQGRKSNDRVTLRPLDSSLDRWLLDNHPFTPVDGNFPEWRRVVPRIVSRGAASFDSRDLDKIDKAFRVLNDQRRTKYMQRKAENYPVIVPNGAGPALVDFKHRNAIAVIFSIDTREQSESVEARASMVCDGESS